MRTYAAADELREQIVYHTDDWVDVLYRQTTSSELSAGDRSMISACWRRIEPDHKSRNRC